MNRTYIVLFLVIVILGSLGTAVYMFQTRKLSAVQWDKVHIAEAMIDAKDYDNAVKTLLPAVQVGKRFDGASRAIYDLARAYEGTGSGEALVLWERLVREFPTGEYTDVARLHIAEGLISKNPQQARTMYQEMEKSPKDEIRARATLGVARTFEAENKLDEAGKLYKQILDATADLSVQAPAKDFLSKIHSQLLWSPALDEFCQLYEVERGDSPAKIGQKFKTTAWFVDEANRLEGRPLRLGRKIKVPKEPFWIVVDKGSCRLNLLTESGKFIKWYLVGIGEQSYKTPAGEYSITTKEIDPTWFRTTGGIIPPGADNNALGTRWMGYARGLGIHGTNAPETIGFRKSAGCIRMYNQEVEELYKLVTYGTRVTILEGTETVKTPS